MTLFVGLQEGFETTVFGFSFLFSFLGGLGVFFLFSSSLFF
jgi:hypothetical protein